MSNRPVPAPGTPENYTAVRTLRALERLAFEPMSAPKLADALGVHPRTARRMMQALATEQYVQRDAIAGRRSSTWRATPRLLALAAQMSRRLPLVINGNTLVHKLGVDERSAWFCIPAYTDVLVLAAAGPNSPTPWSLLPASGTVPGKLLIAYRAAWRHSLNEVAPVMSELDADRVRAAGYAMEVTADQLRVAVPVGAADPVAALAIAVPAVPPVTERDGAMLAAAVAASVS